MDAPETSLDNALDVLDAMLEYAHLGEMDTDALQVVRDSIVNSKEALDGYNKMMEPFSHAIGVEDPPSIQQVIDRLKEQWDAGASHPTTMIVFVGCLIVWAESQ